MKPTKSHKFVIWDAKEGITEEFEKQRLWFDREVYWMGEPKESYATKIKHQVDTPYGTKEEESTLTVDGPTYDFFYRTDPYVIKDMLEQGLIRVEV